MSAQLADPALVMALVPDAEKPIFTFLDRWVMCQANEGLRLGLQHAIRLMERR